jgi:hypothetical protein
MSQDMITIICGVAAVVLFALYMMRRSKRHKNSDDND